MFAADNQDEHILASGVASEQVKLGDQLLAFRIHLQKTLDIANKLPILNHSLITDENLKAESTSAQSTIKKSIYDLTELLNLQITDPTIAKNNEKKRKSNNIDDLWEEVIRPQKQLRQNWEGVVNKWHARVQFGSEVSKSKLKVFNQTLWDQVMH